jgi:carbon starvation protein
VFSNVFATVLCVSAWGYFVYQGTIDPLGGVNTIWPLFGISNQMLAGIALLLATTILIKLKRERYVWVTLAPTAWLLVCTLTAGWMKAFSPDSRIGFFALANRYSEAASSGTILAPAKSIVEMQRVALNNYICGTLTVLFVALVVVMVYFTIRMSLQAWSNTKPTAAETPYISRGEGLADAPA